MTPQITQTLSSGNILVVAPEATFGDVIITGIFLLLLATISLNLLFELINV